LSAGRRIQELNARKEPSGAEKVRILSVAIARAFSLTYHFHMSTASNVLGTPLQSCSTKPLTGFFRTGCCDTGADDVGLHLVCCKMTGEFLAFSRSRGNDLMTPNPQWGFPGLKAGDRWCLCVERWKEAHAAKVAPPVVLEATHISTLEFVDLEDLQAHAVPVNAY
jgi:uncharacterized protein (DUF2237 family)